MKRLLIFILLLSFLKSNAQEDTTRYFKYLNTYGVQYPNTWSTNILRAPFKDTSAIGAQPGAIQAGLDGKPYWWDGIRWSVIGSTTDLTAYVRYVDTLTMLSPYARTLYLNAALALKLNIGDSITQYVTPTQLNSFTGKQHAPIYYGSIYNANSWGGLTGFTTNGATDSISSGKIFIGHSSSISTLDYNYYTLLDHWNSTAKIKVTSTSASAGIGTRSTNAYQGFGVYANINFATGTLTIHATNSLGSPVDNIVATSATNLTVSTNDYVILSLERSVDTVYATIRNVTTGSAFVTAKYGYLLNDYTIATPNTGTFSLYAPSGSFTLDSLSITSKEVKNSNLLIVTDSKGEYVSDTWSSRWTQQVSNLYYPTVLSVGGTEGVDELLTRVPEIIALNPSKVLLLTGRNDLNFGMLIDTIKARYSRAVTQLQAAGIIVYHLNCIYETSVNQSAYSAWITSTYGANVIDTYDPTQQVPSILYVDGIHPNQAGNNLIASVVIQSTKINQGLNYADMVRLNAPIPPTYVPVVADATHAGIVSLSAQTLGSGVKTVQELTVLNNINLPNTASSSSGVLNINGSPFLHNYGNITNAFVGGAGNFSMSGGIYNTGIGYGALNGLTSGSHNVGIGALAGNLENTGSFNTYIGVDAGLHNSGSTQSIFIGFNAGVNSYNAGTGLASSNNIMIGRNSGSNVSLNGSDNVLIGNYALQSPAASPQSKFCVTGGSGAYNLLYGDFSTGQLQINAASTPVLDASAQLDVISTTKGFLPPRMTTTQRNAISSPATGLVIYNSTNLALEWYNGTSWITSGNNITPTLDQVTVAGNSSSSPINITGTGGNGYIDVIAQSSNPATPPTGHSRIFADASGRFGWVGSSGFSKAFSGSGLTANRLFTLPDANTTLDGIDNTATLTNKTISGASNTITNISSGALDTGRGISQVLTGGSFKKYNDSMYFFSGEESYTGTLTWTGTTAPSGTANNVYRWQRYGNMVTLNIKIQYSVAGVSITGVTLSWPPDMPVPVIPTGLSSTSDNIFTGSVQGYTSTSGANLAQPIGRIKQSSSVPTIMLTSNGGNVVMYQGTFTFFTQ